jgi:hypothetical protein
MEISGGTIITSEFFVNWFSKRFELWKLRSGGKISSCSS